MCKTRLKSHFCQQRGVPLVILSLDLSFILQESILKDSGKNKDDFMAAKKEFSSTRDAINLFSNQFYAIVGHVRISL